MKRLLPIFIPLLLVAQNQPGRYTPLKTDTIRTSDNSRVTVADSTVFAKRATFNDKVSTDSIGANGTRVTVKDTANFLKPIRPALGRGATFFVAASNASPQEKSQADWVCTGTNDEVTIQKAIDSVAQLTFIGARIMFSTGSFSFGGTVNVNQPVTLYGSGKNRTFFSAAATYQGNLLTLSPASQQFIFKLDEVKVRGNDSSSAGYTGSGVYVANYSEVEFQNCEFRGFAGGAGIRVASSVTSGNGGLEYNRVTNCWFLGNASGIQFDSTNGQVRDWKIENNKNTSGTFIWVKSGADVSNIHITSNLISSISSILIEGGSGYTIATNHFWGGSGAYGIKFSGLPAATNLKAFVVANNFVTYPRVGAGYTNDIVIGTNVDSVDVLANSFRDGSSSTRISIASGANQNGRVMGNSPMAVNLQFGATNGYADTLQSLTPLNNIVVNDSMKVVSSFAVGTSIGSRPTTLSTAVTVTRSGNFPFYESLRTDSAGAVQIGSWDAYGINSAKASKAFSGVQTRIQTATSGSEAGWIRLYTLAKGAQIFPVDVLGETVRLGLSGDATSKLSVKGDNDLANLQTWYRSSSASSVASLDTSGLGTFNGGVTSKALLTVKPLPASPLLTLATFQPSSSTSAVTIDSLVDINIAGRPYAELYQNDTTYALTLTTQSQYYTLTSFNQSGLFNNVTHTDSTITVSKAGVYKITGAFTLTVNNNHEEVHLVFFNGNTEIVKSEMETEMITSGDHYEFSLRCISSLAANDVIKVRAKNITSAGKIVTVVNANWGLEKIN